MLSSPIILYDHPEIAPESPGDLFDATEIDEILTLRTMTLTDDEKGEARATDPRAAAIIDRGRRDARGDAGAPARRHPHRASVGARPTEAPTEPEPRAWWDPGVDAIVRPETDTDRDRRRRGRERAAACACARARRADAQDMFLAGRGHGDGVFNDVDGDEHLAVTLDDDPAAELLHGTAATSTSTPRSSVRGGSR